MFFILLDLLLIGGLVALIIHQVRLKGYLGEKAVEKILTTLPKDQYVVYNNILLQSDYGTTQIDHIVLSVFGVFVIETKNYQGWIFGNERDDYWTQNIYGKKTRFKNPIRQNYGHVKAIERIFSDIDALEIIPIVAFSGRSQLKVNVSSENVITFSQLKDRIGSYTVKMMNFETVLKMGEVLIKNNIDSKENRIEHNRTIKSNLKKNNLKIANNVCPRCGGNLVNRNGKYGRFIGCSNYPKCRFTKKI
ncbi:NERD domain-containing protein [Acetobacterium wieringae]|uniref:NERD domain-containing protein n=1 Tax=Acetobacterium wieringae TaxID=52694 RepID=UPI0026EE925E|nr:NERD domain-containing protein [Acetobacterium wieringae]